MSTTDINGFATTSLTLSTTAGTTFVSVKSPALTGSLVSFSETGIAEPAAQLSITGGNNQTATVGSQLGTQLQVQVTDTYGNPVSSANVTWGIPTSGSLSNSTSVTDSTGYATATLTLGHVVRSTSVQVTSTGLMGSPANFNEVANPGPANTISISSSSYAGVAGDTANFNLSLTVQDQYGNIATDYQGTVDLTSSDAQAILASPVSFTSAQNGIAFTQVTFFVFRRQSNGHCKRFNQYRRQWR